LYAALTSLLVYPAWSAEWDIVPRIALQETYTDNLSLTPDAVKESEWVTQVSPGISVNATGARLRFNADYAPALTYYGRGQQENTVYQRLSATANAEVAPELLFLDAGATVDQYNISLQDPLSTSNVNTTGNLTTARTFFISPYLLRDFGSAVRAEARYTYSVWNSDDTASLSNSIGDRIDLRLASGPAYKRLTWDLNYLTERIDYENDDDTYSAVITANARRSITYTVGLLGQVGYENYDYRVVGPESEGTRWSVGFDWTPSPRTRLAATTGQRFYGDTYSLDFRHRNRLTTWSAAYYEDITNTRSQFFVPATTSTAGYLNTLFQSQYPDPEARQEAVDKFIAQAGLPPSLSAPVDFYTNQLFLVKRLQGSVGLLGVRNSLFANVFQDTREALIGDVVVPITGDFALSNTVKQTGGGLAWNRRIGTESALNVAGTYSRNEFPDTGRIDNLLVLGMSLSRQFQPRLSGSLNYRRQQNDANQSGASYTENAVFATLQMSL
jgi:uncharacterized protein (PEP-CTERM system associated)